MSDRLSWTAARRIALRAQGIGGARAEEPVDAARSRRSLRRTLETTHLLQIDSVSVFARAHHMPVFTRRGCWDTSVLDRASRPGRGRLVEEALAHEAAYTTFEVHDLLDFRRRRAATRDWGAVRRAAGSDPGVIDRVLTEIGRNAPISAAGLARHLGDHERPEKGWGWRRSDTQWLVEYLFRSGRLDCVGRSAQFERLYDLPAQGTRAAPSGDADRLEAETGAEEARDAEDAHARLTELAAAALGIATPADITDYFRLRAAEVTPHLGRMVDQGTLREVTVRHPRGERTMLLHHGAPRPAPVSAAALLSPFDPVAFHRPRLRDLFDVDYRIGIYTPREKRTHGYYALPLLLDDRIMARVDLRSDRRRGVLEVREAHLEPLPAMRKNEKMQGPERIGSALAQELARAARWQGLGSIEIHEVGDLAPALATAVAERGGTDLSERVL
ncbi:winged helix-turn-helix domain-containing protein [Brachybacterium endophyticum]|uniref:Winged helix-turn-helix domain-containing protein n=1 Tax=Brachybacterium endophyticum TaxID=2182385 RepID=A0A2U2RH17_9MICO|nr:crosslink repair DNA glycosylase YcaQ family protein [Brachybacterium endophyticum]PWH05162.1 winged helix-turn-helix domain-containing protein [Brachybacterium endophyticum]